jgi:hypothetical protein
MERYCRGVIGARLGTKAGNIVDALAQKLDARLHEWKPGPWQNLESASRAVIELADHDVLGVTRSRAPE